MNIKTTHVQSSDPTVVTHRVLELEDGQKIHIKSTNPYGLWKINFNKGQLPDKLKGEYTSYEYALRDVTLYLNQKERKLVKE